MKNNSNKNSVNGPKPDDKMRFIVAADYQMGPYDGLCISSDKFMDNKLISNENLFKANNLELPKIVDEVCAGMYVFNVKKYSYFFEHIFYLYTKDIKKIKFIP